MDLRSIESKETGVYRNRGGGEALNGNQLNSKAK